MVCVEYIYIIRAICHNQYSFIRDHSTTRALLRNIGRITHGFSSDRATVTLSLNSEQAFDNIWRTGLIAELIRAKIHPHFSHIIHSYLQNWTFSVMHINSYSGLHPSQAVVPWVSFLGPTLFNVYINDIPLVENDSNIAISFCADDMNINIWSSSIDIVVTKLNSGKGLLEPWFRKLRLRINTKNAQLHRFPNDCTIIAAVRIQ
jgi:hypothetical protein